MELGLSQHQAIKQIQTLSPQMYLSMEILCLNSTDLQERVEQELEDNATLERSEDNSLTGSEEAQAESGSAEETEGSVDSTEDPLGSLEDRMERLDRYSQDDGPPSRMSSSYSGERDEKQEAMSNTAERPISLQDHLEDQVHLLSDEEILSVMRRFESRAVPAGESSPEAPPAPVEPPATAPADPVANGAAEDKPAEDIPAENNPEQAGPQAEASPAFDFSDETVVRIRELCSELIYNIDDRGYLMYSLEEVLDSMESPAPLVLLEIALEIVQDLEPTGVGGRGIEECLLLQLKKDRQDYPLEERIIKEFLSELGHNQLPKIARALGVGIEDLKDAVANIAYLEPMPGKNYGGDLPLYVKPDVLVDEIEGKYVVRVDSDFMPRLRVSAHYRELFRQSRKDPEVKKYLKKKLDNAEWLIAAIRQRQSTLQKIAQEIVNIQSDFLDHGISKLKPLKMADVAEIIGVHVSTISRGISGKYIQTPQGIYDLRSFFSGGATKAGGDVEARGSVIQRIKDFIAEEDKDRPLSDIAIVRKLEEVGISISRRTVTKYREAEAIPSSRERREY
ncbi:MAG: RNA polymerase factor sigma-54 [Planctomycetota bacterium]|nr:RNA polymerase factor sigma-54 [Planctomycetota bacterium]